MSNRTLQITQAEKRRLESKAKQGWKCYFIERDYANNLQELRATHRPYVEQIRNGREVDITHLTQMFLELYDKVGEMCDCPVCLNSMTKNDTSLPLCGHLICKTCKANPVLDKCPICRKPY